MRGFVFGVLFGVFAIGCATPRASAEGVTPVIAISPGVAGRLALMDKYRLHDEDRKHMMARPHVWVEEAPEDEAEESEPGGAADNAAPDTPAPIASDQTSGR